MESSHIKLHIWLQAFYLMASSKKGINFHLRFTGLLALPTSPPVFSPIAFAKPCGRVFAPPMGSGGKPVEVDERGGSARSFHVDGVRTDDLLPIIRANLCCEARLTDEAGSHKVIAEIS
jgi:hypothetical protein